MLIRFILATVFLTAFFVLAIPVLQITALFSAQAPSSIELATTQTDEERPVDIAESLNEISPAAGDVFEEPEEGFGDFFRSEQPAGFSDTIPYEDINSAQPELDL